MLARPRGVLRDRGVRDEKGVGDPAAHLDGKVVARGVGIGSPQHDVQALLRPKAPHRLGEVVPEASPVIPQEQRGTLRGAAPPQVALGTAHALDHRTRIGEKRLALGGESDRLALAHEQAHAKLPLKGRDGMAHRRLDDMAHLGGPREPAHVCHGNKVFELAYLHGGAPFRLPRSVAIRRLGSPHQRVAQRSFGVPIFLENVAQISSKMKYAPGGGTYAQHRP